MFNTLRVIISQVWVIRRRLNINWKKIHSVILSATCHSLRNFPHSYTSPHIHLWIFETLWVIIFWVWVICKRLNVNWEKIHSIIFCHFYIKKLSPLIHIPSISIRKFLKPYDWFISWVWVICKRLKCELGKNSLSNFICHLSFLKKPFPPLIHIPSYPFVNVQHPMSYYFSSLSHS